LGSSLTSRPSHITVAKRRVGVTGSDVLLDTWAWWELLRGSKKGAAIQRRFLRSGRIRVHTSAITIGEITAKLASMGERGRVDIVLGSIRRTGPIHDVTVEVARTAGLIRAVLRKSAREASLADGIVLATARSVGAQLVSADSAFKGQPDVLRNP
jgi:predicted nucleic acid-binding protein